MHGEISDLFCHSTAAEHDHGGHRNQSECELGSSHPFISSMFRDSIIDMIGALQSGSHDCRLLGIFDVFASFRAAEPREPISCILW